MGKWRVEREEREREGSGRVGRRWMGAEEIGENGDRMKREKRGRGRKGGWRGSG